MSSPPGKAQTAAPPRPMPPSSGKSSCPSKSWRRNSSSSGRSTCPCRKRKRTSYPASLPSSEGSCYSELLAYSE